MSHDPFARLRIEYGDAPLPFEAAPAAPLPLLAQWLDEAAAAGVGEPNGMALATVDADGQPHCRVVLCKGLDERGIAFFTNRQSDKGAQLAGNPRAAATFWWPAPRNRQVRLTGRIELAADAESDAYFHGRPRRAQLCSAASPQSRVVRDRAELEGFVDALAARVGDGPVPRPAHWGGYRLVPEAVEFWQGRDGRVHDRLRYRRAAARGTAAGEAAAGGAWSRERLAP
jgi:pyridoxamine 5'-phosphate oxidase